jgi:transposase
MTEKTSSKKRRKYDADFKAEVLKMVASGKPVKEVAQGLGIGEKIIYRWKSKQRLVSSQQGKAGTGADVGQEVNQLREKLRQTEPERDSPEKSPGHFQPGELKMIYQFIEQVEEEFPVSQLCKLFKVSRSAYYGWKVRQSYRPAEPQEEQARVEKVFWLHKRRYGTRRLVTELQEMDLQTGRKKVQRLMQMQGLVAIQPRSFVPGTTDLPVKSCI